MKRCEKPKDTNVPNEPEVIHLETGDTVRRLTGTFRGYVYMLVHIDGTTYLVDIETGVWWDKCDGKLPIYDWYSGGNQKAWEKVDCCFTVEGE